jgi:6-phosphogluconolactonase
LDRRFLVGTYTTGRDARGVYLCTLTDTGRLDVKAECMVDDPSFIVLHPRLPLVYVVNEAPAQQGGVAVIGIDGDRLRVRQQVESAGDVPCHLCVLPDARALAVVHYHSGTITVFGLDDDGLFTGVRQSWRHEGGAGHSTRQESAHPHCAVARPQALCVTDLGQDAIVSYAFDSWREVGRCAIHAAAGARHLCFARDGTVAWLSNELDNTASRLAVHPDGRLTEIDWVSTLPADFSGRSAVSDIAVHPGGRWLYVGNRGHDSIAWFDIGDGGVLIWRGAEPTQGHHPRHFALTADGQVLVAANRDSNSLVPFRIDHRNGQPVPFGTPFPGVPSPACVCWLP